MAGVTLTQFPLFSPPWGTRPALSRSKNRLDCTQISFHFYFTYIFGLKAYYVFIENAVCYFNSLYIFSWNIQSTKIGGVQIMELYTYFDREITLKIDFWLLCNKEQHAMSCLAAVNDKRTDRPQRLTDQIDRNSKLYQLSFEKKTTIAVLIKPLTREDNFT